MLACAVGTTGVARADAAASRNGDGAALGSLARSLVHWIEKASGHDVTPVVAAPPDIVFVSPGDRIVLPGETVSIRHGMAGLYSPHVDAIFLVLPWSLDETGDQGLLLHQLVRAVQRANGSGSCTARLEAEAHALLMRWFAERGVVPTIEPPSSATPSSCTTPTLTL